VESEDGSKVCLRFLGQNAVDSYLTSSAVHYGQKRTSIAHAATRCTHVWQILHAAGRRAPQNEDHRGAGAVAVAAQSSAVAVAVLVVKANTLVILQYVSRLHGPQPFMKAGPRRLTSQYCPRVLHCAVHAAATMTIASPCRGGAAACLDALRANEKDVDGRFPRRGNKSNPPTRYVARSRDQMWSLESFIRSLDCAFVPDDAAVQRLHGTWHSVHGAESGYTS
jgi:hypothetical protein